MTKIILNKLFSREGREIIITAPSNAAMILSQVRLGGLYEVTYRLHNHKDTIIGEYNGATDFNKSLRFKHSERVNDFGHKVEMLIPTQNILTIEVLN